MSRAAAAPASATLTLRRPDGRVAPSGGAAMMASTPVGPEYRRAMSDGLFDL
jgi:hypothetical protein